MSHILHTKHSETNPFRCAVIVNDMAELNIDQSLVEQSSIVQSDEIVAMQNGCVCCSLQNDLLEQITKLAASKNFDYMIIEGSGVSEPAQIAKLFADCEGDHDHENAHARTPCGASRSIGHMRHLSSMFQHAGRQTSLARTLQGELVATLGRAN